jgi:hypothetical protein
VNKNYSPSAGIPTLSGFLQKAITAQIIIYYLTYAQQSAAVHFSTL